jgi:hypothetical protein
MSGTHQEHENDPWTIDVVDHLPRKESPEYVASRKLMMKIIDTVDDWVLGAGPYQDHHGGSVWVKDDEGWLFTQLPLGIEWSAQFCADPAKIDKLRAMANRIVGAFPDTLPAYEQLGYDAGKNLLSTPIKTPTDIAHWTDSIFNASMPIPAALHTGKLPKGAGYHHYPKPIVDIDRFRRDDFNLFVTDQKGLPAVVVPASADPHDKRVWLLGANHGSTYAAKLSTPREPTTHREPPTDAAPRLGVQDIEPDFAPEPGQPTYTEDIIEHPALLKADDYLARKAFGDPPRRG